MSWNVLLTASALAETGRAALELLRHAGCKITPPDSAGSSPPGSRLALLPDCDAVIAGVDKFSAAVLASPAASRLKIISRWGVGFDSVDVSAATQNGIVVCNTPGLLDEAVADYSFALLLALARQIHAGHTIMQSGDWKQSWGCDVHGKTLGLIGCGRIGRAVARRAAGFNLRVLAADSNARSGAGTSAIQFVSLEELLATSDFVSLHAPLTPENRDLIGETQLRKMKPSALFINAARGPLVDEAALARALREGWIAGAALDVFCQEPLPADHPLRTAPNLLLTPHQASFARDTGERVSRAAAQAILDLLQGRRPQFVVNPEVFASPALRVPIPA
ncbi:MAG: hydroxyacid dehydrogenase [Pedosphaera sp.]|nr:hydroxyacid dehydrogenase [Pedosphaera sp.]